MIHEEHTIPASMYQDQGSNYGYIVIPAGKQHDGEKMVQWYHLIYEDFHWTGPNGEHKLVDEFELKEILNTNYNNQI
jgi:hypothetical protein